MGGDPVRVPDTNVWGRSSTQVFHKNFENTDFAIEKIESEISDLHRRHFDNGNLDNRDRDSQKYNNSPLTKFGVHNKLQEISVRANPNIRISGSSDRQSKNDFLNTHRENSEIRNPLSQYPAKRENNNKGISQLDREFNGNSPSLNSCPTTGEVSSKMSEQTFEEIPTKLRIHNSIGSPGKGGTELVARKYEAEKRESNQNTPTRIDYLFRCSEKQQGRLGSPLWGGLNRRSMDSRGETREHKCFRTESSTACNKNIYQGQTGQIHTSLVRQHDSPSTPHQNGASNITNSNQLDQGDLVISTSKGDHSYCRVHPINSEQRSGLSVQECKGLERVETKSQNISENKKAMGFSINRSVCLKDVPPTSQILQLETRSSLLRGRCINTEMGSGSTVCISTILSDRAEPRKNPEVNNRVSNHNNTNLDNQTLVPSSAGNAHGSPKNNSNRPKNPTTSIRGTTPTASEQHNEISCVESFGEGTTTQGLSETASALIEQSKSEGTRSRYRSAWNNFKSWCSERKVDPFSCSIEEIMNYLSSLFDKGREYNTINGHRSAISTLHQQVEGYPIGQHPRICELMKGIARMKPPTPRYINIWDVDQVLKYFKTMPDNEKLNRKDLSLKTITLIGLIAPNRGSELTELDLGLSGKTETTFMFHLPKPAKNFKQGKKNNPIEIRKFNQDRKLCPYEALENYIKSTAEDRVKQNTTKLFLSYVSPHKPVGKDTTARWVKETLSRAGIDSAIFRPHSKRSASTSKAFSKGASLKDILQMGNWSNESVWQRFYHNEFSTAERYQNTILTGL